MQVEGNVLVKVSNQIESAILTGPVAARALQGGGPRYPYPKQVWSPAAFAAGHIDGSLNLPHRELTETNLAHYDADQLFVVYCAGPHCTGADKAGRNLAALGRPVKKMIGGVTGWIDEGFSLVGGA